MVLLGRVRPWHLKDQTRKVLSRADLALSLCLLVSLSKVHHEGAPGLSASVKWKAAAIPEVFQQSGRLIVDVFSLTGIQ